MYLKSNVTHSMVYKIRNELTITIILYWMIISSCFRKFHNGIESLSPICPNLFQRKYNWFRWWLFFIDRCNCILFLIIIEIRQLSFSDFNILKACKLVVTNLVLNLLEKIFINYNIQLSKEKIQMYKFYNQKSSLYLCIKLFLRRIK